VPGPAVILKAWDGVLRKNSLRTNDAEKTRCERALRAKAALAPLVWDELQRKLEREPERV
jgi:hypothetical protein